MHYYGSAEAIDPTVKHWQYKWKNNHKKSGEYNIELETRPNCLRNYPVASEHKFPQTKM